MAKIGVIPKIMRKYKIPMFSAFLYAKVIKKSWREEKNLTHEPRATTELGELVSAD